MICIASIICADDVVGKNAVALPYIVRKNKYKKRTCVCFANVACTVFITCKICVFVTHFEFANTAGISSV